MREEPLSYDPFTTSDALGPFGKLLLKLARWLAMAGGLIFVGLVLMQLVSVVGRKLFSFAVPGDVEVLQMCAAFALASFFPYCHLIHGDIKVDFFTHNMAPNKTAFLDAAGSLTVALFGGLLAWRTGVGALSLKEVGETSPILAWPVWIAQGLMVPCFALLAIAGLYMCFHQLRLAVWRSL